MQPTTMDMITATETRRFITFAISNYCEKARWALDWHKIRYEEIGWPPGLHVPLARRLGAKLSTLPILIDDGELIQGSDEIIDWADRNAPANSPMLATVDDPESAKTIVQRANDVLGVHVRRLFYAEVLTHHPELAKPWLFLNTSATHRLIGNLTWPVVRRVMIKAMDARPDAAPDSRTKVVGELEWLDAMLEDGRRFLAGDRFSHVDLTVASLLAPFARPEQANVYAAMTLPQALADDVARWRERRVMEWVRSLYREHR